MSVSFGCRCEVKDKRNWLVVHRYHNHSHFESPKGAEHQSDYSTVRCTKCGAIGSTKATYVDGLADDDNRDGWI